MTQDTGFKAFVWYVGDDSVASIEVYKDCAFFRCNGVKETHTISIPLHLVDAYLERLTLLYGAYNVKI